MDDDTTRVFVAEDEITVRRMIHNCLLRMGVKEVEQAQDGEEAWSSLLFSAHDPGLIICDWDMPGMTGIDLLKRLRSTDRYKEVPFLMITSDADMHMVQEAISSGTNGYLVKPLSYKSLREQVEKITNFELI